MHIIWQYIIYIIFLAPLYTVILDVIILFSKYIIHIVQLIALLIIEPTFMQGVDRLWRDLQEEIPRYGII